MSDLPGQMSLLDVLGHKPEPQPSNAPLVDAETPIVAPDVISEVVMPEDDSEADSRCEALLERRFVPLEQHLCFALYSANHAMHGVYKALLKEVGLTYPQFLAMTVLWDEDKVPVGALSNRLQLDTNTMTPLLKRLEGMGLISRERSSRDERQVIVKLTRKGRQLRDKTGHFAQCVFSATGLNAADIMRLQEQIIKLRDQLRAAGVQ